MRGSHACLHSCDWVHAAGVRLLGASCYRCIRRVGGTPLAAGLHGFEGHPHMETRQRFQRSSNNAQVNSSSHAACQWCICWWKVSAIECTILGGAQGCMENANVRQCAG